MYDDILAENEAEDNFNRKAPNELEFKIIFCTICTLYKDCQYAALEQCMKEANEGN